MAHFVYDGPDERVFPTISLTVTPGQVVELDVNPDERYFQPVEAPAQPGPVTEEEVLLPVGTPLPEGAVLVTPPEPAA